MNKKSKRKRFTRLFCAWLTLLCLVACSRFVAGQHRYLDLIAGVSGFVIPLVCLTLLVLTIRGRWILALWALSIGVIVYQPIHASVMATLRGSPNAGALGPGGGWGMGFGGSPYVVTILVANAGGSDAALSKLKQLISRHEPDLVAIIEAGQGTGADYFNSDYSWNEGKYRYVIPPDNSILNSTMLLSRHKLTRLEFADDPKSIDEEIYAFHHTYRVDLGSSLDFQFVFTAAHPPSPRTNASWEKGNEKTRALARLARRELVDSGEAVIIAGDFNAPAIGYRQQIMRSTSALVPSDDLIGGALTGTWPAGNAGMFRLTLDRLWVTPDNVQIIEREVLESIGSDHCPVLFTVDFDPGP